jgi:hypothetical protein
MLWLSGEINISGKRHSISIRIGLSGLKTFQLTHLIIQKAAKKLKKVTKRGKKDLTKYRHRNLIVQVGKSGEKG